MLASKFLHDDGEAEEVVTPEWAILGKLTITRIKKLELDFLDAIVSNILYKTLFLEITKTFYISSFIYIKFIIQFYKIIIT